MLSVKPNWADVWSDMRPDGTDIWSDVGPDYLTLYFILCFRSHQDVFLRTVSGGEASLFIDLDELVIGEDGQPTHEAPLSQAKNLVEQLEEQLESVEREHIAMKEGHMSLMKGQNKIMGHLKFLMTLMKQR
uniref:Uncharacterized protein n=1 Tax=Cannabis sativa TaxID=3483 RepID=A0A803NZ07_CANSA